MTWEVLEVPAVRGGAALVAQVRIAVGDACHVDVLVGDLVVHGVGPDLFEALTIVRVELGKREVLLRCNGARRDVFPSPMLRQASSGRRAYVLTMPRMTVKPPTVDIFSQAPDGTYLASVAEQRAWFDRWRQMKPQGRRDPDEDASVPRWE